MSASKTFVTKDFAAKCITVSREFDAALPLVWRAYTEAALLDQWWGPAPWRAETKFLDFRNGGYWLYAMVGPDGQKHWGRMNYLTIDPLKRFAIEDAFCDDQGVVDPNLPVSKGEMVFTRTSGGTRVEFKMTYSTEDQLRKIVEMGFEQGISICLDQLARLLAVVADKQQP